MKKKEDKDFYVVVIVAIIAIFAMVLISNVNINKGVTLEKPTTSYEQYDTEVLEENQPEVEEENIGGLAVKLDDCLKDCQEKVCKTNCIKEDFTLEPTCYRECLDECNEKCLKVYKW